MTAAAARRSGVVRSGAAATTSRRRGRGAVVLGLAVLMGATVLASCGSGPGPYTVTAVFPSAEGLFPGNAVQVLGVASGTVTKVTPTLHDVVVTMSVNGAQALPAGVRAALTTPQLLGEPSIELSPGYSGGPRLRSGAVIPENRTSVPVSTDELLRDLQRYLGTVNAGSVGGLVSNLAQDLRGQGQGLNQLISQGAGTLSELARKGDDLGQLEGSLSAITGTLRQRTATVSQLLQSYSALSHVLATNSGPLGDSITQLADASQQLSTLFGPNLQPLQGDVGTITQVGRTLDRNLSSLDQGLSSAVALFSAAGRAYDPTYNWLNLNNQLAPGVTGTVLAGLVRDRLAGICRRVLASHASGLSTGDVQTLQSCGNPASGYFDPLLSVIPSLLAGTDTASGASTPSAQQLITRGLGKIPGLSSAQRATVAQLPPSSLATPSTTTPATSTLGGGLQLPVQAPVTDQQANSGGLLGGLVHGVLGVGHFFGSIL